MMFDLSNKLALVTGCKKGIGKAMAIGLAKNGADIIGVSSSLELTNSSVGKEVENLGRKFYPYKSDFSNREDLYTFIKKVLSDHPKVDILVNNAGTIRREKAENHSDEYWDLVMEVNLNSQFIITREIGKQMLANQSGKIIFIASLLTFQGGITVPGYAASKGAIGQLTKAFANEWASKGINVNAIAPGYIRTDNTEALQKDKERSDSILMRVPQGRWGEPDDFEGPIVFLSSQASDYVNGTILTVDGGWMGR